MITWLGPVSSLITIGCLVFLETPRVRPVWRQAGVHLWRTTKPGPRSGKRDARLRVVLDDPAPSLSEMIVALAMMLVGLAMIGLTLLAMLVPQEVASVPPVWTLAFPLLLVLLALLRITGHAEDFRQAVRRRAELAIPPADRLAENAAEAGLAS
jgi:hypothetical protein